MLVKGFDNEKYLKLQSQKIKERIKLFGEKLYLEFADMFVWPDNEAPAQDVHFCMGLRDHIGVLSDGTVVPCCLDADGSIPLGNLFNEELTDIVSSPRAKAIYDGFSQNKCSEEMCKHCQYATRFG